MPLTKVIDLSHHNSIPVDLTGAAGAGVRGLIHKLTQGTSYTDPKVSARWYLTKEAGLHWGLYTYLNAGPLRPQIDYFWQQAQGRSDENTLLALDYEEIGIPLDQVVDALAYLQSLSQRRPVLYSGHILKSAGGAAAEPALLNYRLWLAQYASAPVLPAGYTSWWLWQFTDKGAVPGIDGAVDCNAFAGSDAELASEWAGAGGSGTGKPVVTITIEAPPDVEVKIVRP